MDERMMTRRGLLKRGSLLGLAVASGLLGGCLSSRAAPGAPSIRRSGQELRISRILIQNAPGRRVTPVAPNAFAAYRGYEVHEPLIRIQTDQGIEGVTRVLNPEQREEVLTRLIGLDPFDLFEWIDDRYAGPAEEHDELVRSLHGIDMALFDLMGKATGRPVAELLGPREHEAVDVYDSSLYMEDLLTGAEREGLAYLGGRRPPSHPAEMVASKAEWLVNDQYREQGVRIFKIKTGRARWMDSYEEALRRDIEVFQRVRQRIGNEYTLFVDVNNGYDADHHAAVDFITQTQDHALFGIEEMFQESKVDEYREVKEHAYRLGLHVRMIDGETPGIPFELLRERFEGPSGEESLFDINNPSFSHRLGFVRVHETAQESRRRGVLVAPHTFASKIGFYASVHLAHTQPNWAFCETDDSSFPGVSNIGIDVRNGKAQLTGAPGLGIVLHEEHLDAPTLVLSA
jgi:D-galactarolactone cycloisomerase